MLPPTAWKQLADAQVDGWRRWDPEASPRPHRLWSRGDEVANVVELGCLRRSLLIGQLHPYNRGGHEESHPPVHLSHEPDRWDGVRYLRV